MMKVSFKGDYKNILTFQDKVTVVTLTGKVVVELEHIPHHIWTWAFEHPSVDISVTYNGGNENWILKASGKSKCHSKDVPNAAIGKRIAESKAKIKIYKFMHTLCHKLYEYYYEIALGDHYGVQIIEVGNYLHGKYQFGGIFRDMSKYQGLLIKESHHLGELIKNL